MISNEGAGCFIGVDPGVSGAISLYDEDGFLWVWDVPVFAIKGKKHIDLYTLAKLIGSVRRARGACIELVGAMPKQGVTSSFNFGQSYGMIQGIIAAHLIPIRLVRPQEWKKEFKLGADKDQCRQAAMRFWPHQSELFKRKMDDGRAESALIAKWSASHVA